LSAAKQIEFNPQGKIAAGELSLDGKLRPIRGAVSLALAAYERGFREIILPKENAKEASLISAQSTTEMISTTTFPKIIGAESLKEVIDYLEGKIQIRPFLMDAKDFFQRPAYSMDFGLIKGQESSKRALQITAAGGHNLLMQGPPGAGKSLLASALPSILPSLGFEESVEITRIYSVAGLLTKDKPFINIRPFRSPHHTSSEVALIGGGNPPRPGEITLAHRGVLFLDEFPEFHRDALESLRQPIEEGKITILRAKHYLTFPARFTLVAAANPCPCGYYRDPERHCNCLPAQIAKYRRKLSGPLMDRIDIFIDVPQLKFEKLTKPDLENPTAETREKIEKAHLIQKERFISSYNTEQVKMVLNSEMHLSQIKKYCQINSKSQDILRRFVDSGKLSARGYHRVLKVARTIADLDNSANIHSDNIAEALMYRIRES